MKLRTSILLAACFAVAQAEAAPALLVADSVTVSGEDRLIAQGSVVATINGQRIEASRIVYDRATEQLGISGPIRIIDETGTMILANAAEMDSSFTNAIIEGARMVLDDHLQISAAQMNRVEGRYSQLSSIAMTSCQVCGASDTPLWQIRAKSAVHDQREKQIYVRGAQLRVLDVPVAYLPYLRLPDPTLKRSRGFLIPQIKSNTLLGYGIKAPYFIPLGDHRDITLTPYLSQQSRTLEWRYRQAFKTGDISVRGAVSWDQLNDGPRSYLNADGRFDLGHDYKLAFDVEATSEDSYLSDYGYSTKDRLDSAISVWRTTRNDYREVSTVVYETLRDTEQNATQATIISDAIYEKRIFPKALGGEIRMTTVAHQHFRYSKADVVGRDVARVNAETSWRNRWTVGGGLRLGLLGQIAIDHTRSFQNSTVEASVTKITPEIMVDARLPLRKSGAKANYIMEPIVQLAYSGGSQGVTANDESTRVEFDEGNLVALSRFPARDRREYGLRGAIGFRWAMHTHKNLRIGVTLGRAYFKSGPADYTLSSGLHSGDQATLVAAQISGDHLAWTTRFAIGSKASVRKAESVLDWSKGKISASASYLLLGADVAEGRSADISEWGLSASYQATQNWKTGTFIKYDAANKRATSAGISVAFRNECVAIDFSLSRNFISSTNLKPATNYGLTIELKGFGSGGSDKEYRRMCRT